MLPHAPVSRAGFGGGVFDPAVWYGHGHGVALTVGMRLGARVRMHRMGRYRPEPADDMSSMPRS